MAVVSKHDAIVSMSASSSFPFGIVLFSVFCGQSPLLRYIAFLLSLFLSSLSLSLSDTDKKTLVVLPSVLFCL